MEFEPQVLLTLKEQLMLLKVVLLVDGQSEQLTSQVET